MLLELNLYPVNLAPAKLNPGLRVFWWNQVTIVRCYLWVDTLALTSLRCHHTKGFKSAEGREHRCLACHNVNSSRYFSRSWLVLRHPGAVVSWMGNGVQIKPLCGLLSFPLVILSGGTSSLPFVALTSLCVISPWWSLAWCCTPCPCHCRLRSSRLPCHGAGTSTHTAELWCSRARLITSLCHGVQHSPCLTCPLPLSHQGSGLQFFCAGRAHLCWWCFWTRGWHSFHQVKSWTLTYLNNFNKMGETGGDVTNNPAYLVTDCCMTV